MNTLGIIQARMGSTRLAGKVLMPILDKPMLAWVVERARRARLIDGVVVATTLNPEDDAIVALCEAEKWDYFRGSQEDVLDRYYQAALPHQPATVVRITADCPLIDPQVTDYVIAAYYAHGVDYANNFTPRRTYPQGLDTEAFRFAALERAWREDESLRWREHVTPYIHQQPDHFQLWSVTHHVDFSGYRWTVDTAADLALVRRIYEHFGHGGFGWHEVVAAYQPAWHAINRDVQQKWI